MNILIFREFLEIFLNLFKIFKVLKSIKNAKKEGSFIAWDPRGCDVAWRAMWQSHADPRECQRGADVTRVHIYIYS